MKLLVVDVGNTSTAVGLWDRGRVSHVAHFDGGFEEAKLQVLRLKSQLLSRLKSQVSCPSLALAYISVVPAVDAKWRAFARREGLAFVPVSYRDFGRGHETGDGRRERISLDYPKPSTIGADRLADAAGAVSRYGAPVLVMDFGTALTAAVVTEDRVWRGGVIAPGFPLMRDYLFERTAKLPRMELGKGRPPKIGRSTEEAMRFGALVGYRGMVREIVAQLQKNFKTEFRLVATGGFARWALRDLDLPFTIDPTLTLYGAGLIANGKSKMENGKCKAGRA